MQCINLINKKYNYSIFRSPWTWINFRSRWVLEVREPCISHKHCWQPTKDKTIGHFRWMSIIRVFPSSSLTATTKDETTENCFDIGIWSFGQLWPVLHGYKSYSTLCTKCSALYLSKTALIKHISYWRNYATGMINLSMESLFVMWNGRGVIVEADIRLSEELATEGCS